MNASFQPQFCPPVEEGSKRHTIRRGKRWKVGMRIDCYTGLRTKKTRLLFRAMVTKVEDIQICETSHPVREFIPDLRNGGMLDVTKWDSACLRFTVTIEGNELRDDEMDSLFYRDGFRASGSRPSEQAAAFWADGLPFDGQIIHWDWDNRFMKLPKKEKRPRRV